MAVYNGAFVDKQISRRTFIFGLHLWVVIGILVGVVGVLILFLLSLCIIAYCTRGSDGGKLIRRTAARETTPPVMLSDIQDMVHSGHRPILSQVAQDIQIDIGKVQHRVVFYNKGGSSGERRTTIECDASSYGRSGSLPEVSHLGWGRWYTLRELEAASNGLSDENVIGEGEYGIVYYGVLADNTKIAIKNLLNNMGQAQMEFKVEVDVIGRARHMNLVRLLGYCVEGAYRMIVYEYVDNGNLDQWLHGNVGDVSPLTWEIRMNIIIGCAKGLAYLHEGLEPMVIHRNIKSGSILLDQQWHAKLSDFGLAILMNADTSYMTTRVMGAPGYIDPEYASTSMLNEKSDVYSFGILVMEIVTGRSPVEYSHAKEEVTLGDWLNMMVENKKIEEVVDPKLPKKPSRKMLKRVISVALKCVDREVTKRPKMGHVIHMLESEDFLSRHERRTARESSEFNHGNNNPSSLLTKTAR